ncbi:hypothetical protein INT47_008839 [Mucor saturninus]|uniref:BLOC-1-related complex subunit 5 n=1 Tax=Mucor saturninus TaxID=64648 RepID=A0A8H7R171_9FUNG|nr:hypothetical protein INT47_008839 [Mucor saturninus]
MGQDQSNPSRARSSPAVTPSSSSTSHNSKSFLQNKIFIHPSQDDENEDLEDEDVHEGIIQVVKGPGEEEEDPELTLLRSIKRFEPFVKEQDKSFSLEHLLGLKSNTKSTAKDNDTSLNPAFEIYFELQAHLKEQMTRVNNEQRILLRRIAYVDELSTQSAQVITSAFNQAQSASNRISEATLIKEQAEKTQAYAINIFKSLTALEKYLDPEDIIGNDENTRWPELSELRHRASKCNAPYDRLSKSATLSDLTTVGSSTSPLLERVIVTGEPAHPLNQQIEPNTEDDPAESSTSTSSLALSRLRGLSSRTVTTDV